jgi:flagellar P-ring protein precursor FlgI
MSELQLRRHFRADGRARAVGVACALISIVLMCTASLLSAQSRIRDLVLADGAAPVRVVGYGLVAGLDGTGDRGMGGSMGGQTVQSIVNLLRRFDINVPANVLRSRNVAAVLVTAEVSAYLRPGGRFDVQIASIGDAPSLRGGVLYMTPLIAEVGGTPMATAQGGVVLSEGSDRNGARSYGTRVETSARVPAGGVVEVDLRHRHLRTVAARPRHCRRQPHCSGDRQCHRRRHRTCGRSGLGDAHAQGLRRLGAQCRNQQTARAADPCGSRRESGDRRA